LLSTLLCAVAMPAASQQQKAKRPLTHDDYAAWRGLQSPALSPDGSLLAYAVAPQDGDGEFILRQPNTGKEYRHPRGSRPAAPIPPARPARAPTAPTVAAHLFSPDGKFVVFPIYPPKPDKTKGKTPPSLTTSMGIMETASGKVASVERVRSY